MHELQRGKGITMPSYWSKFNLSDADETEVEVEFDISSWGSSGSYLEPPESIESES